MAEVGKRPGETMRAIVQDGYGSAEVLKLREIAKPELDDDHVLVAVRAASVNAADCHFIAGALPVRVIAGLRVPKVPVRGVDFAGLVEAVGSHVTSFKPGDEVFGSAPGSFAEYVSAREDRVVPKPSRLTFEEAAAMPTAGVTALQGLRDKAHLEPGQRVLVYGAGGGVGTFAVQIAKAFGAHVTAVTHTRNTELVRSLGADEVVDYTQEDVTRRPERYDVFFDVAATSPVVACLRLVEPSGVFVGAGAAKGGSLALVRRLVTIALMRRLPRRRLLTFLARLRGEDLTALADLVEAGKLRPAIDRTYPLREFQEAVRYALSGRARAKVVITFP